MGGIGKTTLARIAFNDDNVKSHFDKKIWVCVSNPFDEIRIARAVLNSLDVRASNLGQLEPLLERIRKSIEGNKFLLVLDDMWIDSPRIWEEFKHSLRYGSQGSRILVTTRKTNVANIMGTTNMIKLETLSEDESWSLFSQVALSERSGEECERLENIGRTIVGKCRGLPHAIKTLGSILRFKRHSIAWKSVLDDDLWKEDEIAKDLFLPFLFCYYDLPPKLRNCFLYCAIFPKGYEIRKHKLIDLWMAQGYLKKERNVDMEIVGEEYFETLAMRSFFRDFELDGGITKCKMHDIMHDFAQYLGQNECFSIEVDGHVVSGLELSHRGSRHLIVIGNSIPNSIYNEKALRSLIVNTTVDIEVRADLPKLFDQFTSLRSLDLSFFSIEELPRGIQKLVHLRYLNLSGNNRLKELPKELCDLYHLETLDFSGCSYIQKLPRRIGRLINLRYLINMNTFNISYMPKGIESLTCLRTLSEFIVSGGGRDNKA
ncbi:putative disease resistance protein RGA3 isoform X1 [Pistacia vera]|nr:putative disease resistance protein RGA3 isoform X1 [Pistacia vera]XP_031286183.1 putative disease resistance protein RGA3 isoform X1 [Pistacia vera]XP_031286184.1 putative disease resistance protein RGA3 isoform X1 [Pistacia vera]XP_031286185.1 putative disease resistance protein RGA3 isoform X1 [Pistacia vera]XP_031286186.1 putative disease resistance protein RGA3 isoform X1 [Pistacia vera]XP_031286187.1 putative disease resistance protein RGA3 isoform X1 [Pistacia vera]